MVRHWGWRSGRGINNPWETGTLGRTDGVAVAAVPWAFTVQAPAADDARSKPRIHSHLMPAVLGSTT